MEMNNQISTLECEEVARLMQRKYSAYLKDKEFNVESKVLVDGVYVTITLKDDSGSFVYPVEGRMKHKEQELSSREASEMLFDYIDLYFAEYLKGEESVFLPIDWSDYSVEEYELQLKGQVINEKLMTLADDLLAGRGLDELH